MEAVLAWAPLVAQMTLPAGISPALILALIWLESGGNPNHIGAPLLGSDYGAVGLMGVVPNEVGGVFANRPSTEELFDPETNVRWGCGILAGFMKGAGGDMRIALYHYSGSTVWESEREFEEDFLRPLCKRAFQISAEMPETGEPPAICQEYVEATPVVESQPEVNVSLAIPVVGALLLVLFMIFRKMKG